MAENTYHGHAAIELLGSLRKGAPVADITVQTPGDPAQN